MGTWTAAGTSENELKDAFEAKSGPLSTVVRLPKWREFNTRVREWLSFNFEMKLT